MTKGVYIASKIVHAPRWRELRAAGVPINSTWIDEAGAGETKSYSDLWRRCITEASSADALIAYVEDGEVLKGAFVEIGAALGNNVSVFIVGAPDDWSFMHHYLVTASSSLERAVLDVMHLVKDREAERAGTELSWFDKLLSIPTEGGRVEYIAATIREAREAECDHAMMLVNQDLVDPLALLRSRAARIRKGEL